MRYLSLEEVRELHRKVLHQSGGGDGVRDMGSLESAVAQPRMAFGGQDLYPGLIEKAAALGHSLVANHPFVDGNKRIGHLAMETFLFFNGKELFADVDEQETMMLMVAEGKISREVFTEWVKKFVQDRPA